MHTLHPFLSTLAILGILWQGALPARAEVLGMPGPAEVDDDGIDVAANDQVPVIDDSFLTDIRFTEVEADSVRMRWTTTSGCTFHLRFRPDEEVDVVAGDRGRCDFETWAQTATMWQDAGEVIPIWDYPEYLSLLGMQVGGGNGRNQGQDPPQVPDPHEFLDVEQADDCTRASVRAGLTTAACVAGFGVAWTATAGTWGAFAFTLGGATAACLLAAMDVQDAINACRDDQDALEWLTIEEMLQLHDYVQDGVLYEVIDPEDMAEQFVDVEQLFEDVEAGVDLQGMHDTFEGLNQRLGEGVSP